MWAHWWEGPVPAHWWAELGPGPLVGWAISRGVSRGRHGSFSLDSLSADDGWPSCPISCLAQEVPALLPGGCWVVPGFSATEPRYLHPVAGLMQQSVPQCTCQQCSRSQSEPQPCTPVFLPTPTFSKRLSKISMKICCPGPQCLWDFICAF